MLLSYFSGTQVNFFVHPRRTPSRQGTSLFFFPRIHEGGFLAERKKFSRKQLDDVLIMDVTGN